MGQVLSNCGARARCLAAMMALDAVVTSHHRRVHVKGYSPTLCAARHAATVRMGGLWAMPGAHLQPQLAVLSPSMAGHRNP